MNNEDFELHPHYPPPHKDGAYPRYWPYWPQWPAGWHGWNDTEPASVGPWGCCPPPHPDDCVCVTQQDIDNWNNISAVSSLSGLDLSPLSSISGMDLPYSATLWNSNYETVYTNSAMWSSAQYIPYLSAYMDNEFSGVWDKLYEIYETSGAINVDRDFYPYTLDGNGTSAWPVGLSSHVISLLHYLDTGNYYDTVEALKHGGLPRVPEHPWIAPMSAINKLENNDTNLNVEIQGIKAEQQEIWQAIELILNIITDKYSNIPDLQDDIRHLTDKIGAHNFVQNNGNP